MSYSQFRQCYIRASEEIDRLKLLAPEAGHKEAVALASQPSPDASSTTRHAKKKAKAIHQGILLEIRIMEPPEKQFPRLIVHALNMKMYQLPCLALAGSDELVGEFTMSLKEVREEFMKQTGCAEHDGFASCLWHSHILFKSLAKELSDKPLVTDARNARKELGALARISGYPSERVCEGAQDLRGGEGGNASRLGSQPDWDRRRGNDCGGGATNWMRSSSRLAPTSTSGGGLQGFESLTKVLTIADGFMNGLGNSLGRRSAVAISENNDLALASCHNVVILVRIVNFILMTTTPTTFSKLKPKEHGAEVPQPPSSLGDDSSGLGASNGVANPPSVAEGTAAKDSTHRLVSAYATVPVGSILQALPTFAEEAQKFCDLVQGIIQRSEACMRSFMEKVVDGREDLGELIEDMATASGTIQTNISSVKQFIEYFLAFATLAVQARQQGQPIAGEAHYLVHLLPGPPLAHEGRAHQALF